MDIDIDIPPNLNIAQILPIAIPASMVRDGNLKKHTCGYYFQTIPVDPITKLAAIPYKEAAEIGYFKFDLLHLTLLNQFKTKQEIRDLINAEPDWTLLWNRECVSTLFQLHSHYDLLDRVKPRSVEVLADCIALIRPGKRRLLEDYIRQPSKIRPQLYRQSNEDKSAFKRSHAIAYALTIVLQLHTFAR